MQVQFSADGRTLVEERVGGVRLQAQAISLWAALDHRVMARDDRRGHDDIVVGETTQAEGSFIKWVRDRLAACDGDQNVGRLIPGGRCEARLQRGLGIGGRGCFYQGSLWQGAGFN